VIRLSINYKREQVIRRLQERIRQNQSILMLGSGSGLSAVSGERGGADLIAVYSTAVLRMRGLPSMIFTLPYYDANAITLEAAEQIAPLVRDTPIILGLGAHDPSVDLERLLDAVQSVNCCGVMNEPFAGIYGDAFAKRLEQSGLGFSRELALIAKARGRGMFTLGWAVSPGEAAAMADAGADSVGAMILDDGPEFQGVSPEERLNAAVEKVQQICEAAHAVNPQVMVLSHGNPFYNAATAGASIERTDAVGYASGSSGERLPAERAITEITQSYREITVNSRKDM
jgi:predicted TIM-barrel enzyme